MTCFFQYHMGHFRPIHLLLLFGIAGIACGDGNPRQSDLPKRPDQWVDSVALDSGSRVEYIGQTKDFIVTSVTTHKPLDAPRAIHVGDEIEGLTIGAINCSFHWRDASYGGEQYMWRGRWACMAGRDSQEVANAVGSDGEKRFPYLHIAPVTLDGE